MPGDRVRELRSIIAHTNKPEKLTAAASGLAAIGSDKAKEALLEIIGGHLAKSALIWPHVVGLLSVDDVPELLAIEQSAERNPRMAAKYKLPPEAQDVLLVYVNERICEAPSSTLLELLSLRYTAISNRTFDLLLQNDTPEIRQALERLALRAAGDMRKADKRAVESFDKLLRRLPEAKGGKLLKEATSAWSLSVSKKAQSLLRDRDPEAAIELLRGKGSLQRHEIQTVAQDGSPASIARLIKEAGNILIWTPPPQDLKKRVSALIFAVGNIKGAKSRKALVSMLDKLVYEGHPFFRDEVVWLCEFLGERREKAALPELRKIADNWEGITMIAAARAILRIDGVNVRDKDHPYARKAREGLKKAKRTHAAERARMSSVDYMLFEDPAEKKSDKGALLAGDLEIAGCEQLLAEDR